MLFLGLFYALKFKNPVKLSQIRMLLLFDNLDLKYTKKCLPLVFVQIIILLILLH